MCKCPIGLNDYWGERKNTMFQIIKVLMQEEEQRAAKEEQSIVFTINMIAWSVACVMLGWIIALI